MEKQAFNPYLPSYEYVPDAEPHVVDGRVYIYGSHDLFNGLNFCLGDYVCWSAPVDDLGNWKYEGCIYKREQDPAAPRIRLTNGLAAPDMVQGPDGRFYLSAINRQENMNSTDMYSMRIRLRSERKMSRFSLIPAFLRTMMAACICIQDLRFREIRSFWMVLSQQNMDQCVLKLTRQIC